MCLENNKQFRFYDESQIYIWDPRFVMKIK